MPGSTVRPRIAVVEDDDAMRRSIERLLNSHGYATEGFADAGAFLDSGAAERASCVVLDINLPGVSGIEMQRRLRASGSTVPVVFITAHDEPGISADAHAVGCVGYLRKPFEAGDLMEAVGRALAG